MLVIAVKIARTFNDVVAPAESRAASFASLNGIQGEEDEYINEYLTDEVKKRNNKYKLPWWFV